MTDTEKIINALENCVQYMGDCINCEYLKHTACKTSLMIDALATLKEQETEDTGSCRIFQCKKCGFGIDDIFVNDEGKYQIVPRYCPNCGRSVK